MKTNRKPQKILTAEGARASRISKELQLKRSVMACMLWERSFYEDGVSIAERISDLCKSVPSDVIAKYARDARNKQHLRHIPLLLCCELAKKKYVKTSEVIYDVVQRADELAELLSIYWSNGKTPIAAQVKKGLANAFTKFNEYQLAKYNRDNAIKLRDVLFLSHAKPLNDDQSSLWKRLIDGSLAVPDTWEVSLSAGHDKKETWRRMISEGKLGALAFLRNIRNMQEAGVSREEIRSGLLSVFPGKVLPFRFIAAAKYAPFLEQDLEFKMLENVSGEKLAGHTVVLVDVSGSMNYAISEKSDMTRLDAACGVAILAREKFENVSVWTFSDNLVEIPNRRGFALMDAIKRSQPNQGTHLGKAIGKICSSFEFDRLIVITDEQSHDSIPDVNFNGYIINVSCERNGIGYDRLVHIDGWSEAVVDFIIEYERSEDE